MTLNKKESETLFHVYDALSEALSRCLINGDSDGETRGLLIDSAMSLRGLLIDAVANSNASTVPFVFRDVRDCDWRTGPVMSFTNADSLDGRLS